MLLSKVRVKKFRSIEDSTEINIERDITVLVGQNESGKTAFLQALSKTTGELGKAFNVMEDHPRRNLSEYRRRHDRDPQNVLELTYTLSDDDLAAIDALVGCKVKTSPTFTITYNYANNSFNNFAVDEQSFLDQFVLSDQVLAELRKSLKPCKTVREVIALLQKTPTELTQGLLSLLTARFQPGRVNWASLLNYEVWSKYVNQRIPKFYYFDDYYLLPGKINLNQLAQARYAHDIDPSMRTALCLLSMAGVSLNDLNPNLGYEGTKAKLEGISNSITDKIFRYWQQNRDLQVEFDIRTDANDVPPYNNGPNLYIRIRNTRHRVSMPFSQRSKGFIWFFSFIVWFDTLQETGLVPPVLLLDEPGLSLHALAQSDLQNYIEDLAQEHQVIYSTHSPFMVRSNALQRARFVEDKPELGTIISDNFTDFHKRTLFPLQAALGYAVAENLIAAKKNLLVSGPKELLYLKHFSAQLEMMGKKGLREDIVLVPVGGLEKVVSFLALASHDRWEAVLLHEGNAQADGRVESLIRQKSILTYGQFLDQSPANKKDKKAAPTATRAADIEDLISLELYVKLVNGAMGPKKTSKHLKEAELPAKERVLARIEAAEAGLNPYNAALHLVTGAIAADAPTLERFEALFSRINGLL